VRDKIIVSTTTNGTRALRACAGAKATIAGSFLNLAATAKFLNLSPPEELLLVCAGTGQELALEDVLAAGALAELVRGDFTDSTQMAARTFHSAKAGLPATLADSQNGRIARGRGILRAAGCDQTGGGDGPLRSHSNRMERLMKKAVRRDGLMVA